MTRQERTLRKAVGILAAATLLLGLLLIWSLRAGIDLGDSGKSGESSEVASIGGQSVSEQQWIDELTNKHGDEVLLGILNRIAVEKEAKALGISVTAKEVDQALRNTMAGYSSEQQYYAQMQSELGLSRQEVREERVYRLTLQAVATAGIVINDSDINEYLKQNEDRFRPKKIIDLSMIKVRTYAEAEGVMDRLDRGEDFSALAKELSIDEESGARGGSLGAVEEDDPFWPEELLTTAAGLDAGDIAGPLQDDDSYAVIRVERITSPEMPSDKEIKAQIRREMALEQAAPLQQVESDLRAKYDAAIYIDNRPQD
ncbi:foldase protein PrsA [Paenibacillus wynnii]|uniref:foldase protein PrsA n=1 Tax=Paenibacillus wynnii TaxID=268407 RepID=UPI0027948DA0|nr:peptidylprolyl isomerase [Paenibacillus wynnii]MDQ0196064.1 foldase protein PrsA [Paenibacillus wynnii]